MNNSVRWDYGYGLPCGPECMSYICWLHMCDWFVGFIFIDESYYILLTQSHIWAGYSHTCGTV